MTSKKNMTSNRSPRRIDRTAGGRNKKAKVKQYPLDEYIEKIWYDDWLKKQNDKPQPKHFWKVGGTD
tara:strand:+ start:186 stop:386 length:201 start_codon:yes stop_codon:yes gene_type:complete